MGGRSYLGLQGTKLQIAVGVIAGMDFLLFGYDQGVTGGLLSLKSFTEVFPTIATTGEYFESLSASEKSTQSTRQGWFHHYPFISPFWRMLTKTLGIAVAAYNLGCFAGSVPTIWIGNWLGRRKTIFLGSAIMVVGAILQCTAYHLTQLIIGRLITGFGKHIIIRG